MSVERRLPKSWARYLADEDNPVTLFEFGIACQSLMLGHIIAMRQAMEHVEGMAGARDAFDAALAEANGVAYPASAQVRAALDAQRDEQRRLAAQERARALREGEG